MEKSNDGRDAASTYDGSGKMSSDTPEQRTTTELAADRTRWAADRTLWAADRTFIAWLRTAISMIGFGVGIGKAGDILEGYGYEFEDSVSLQIVGLAFVALAVLGLVGALVQDIRISKRLSEAGYGRIEPTPLGRVMGILVLIVGIAGGIVIFW